VTFEGWATLAQVAATIVAIVSMIGVIQQLSEIRKSLRAEAFEATATRIIEITRLFLDHSEAAEELAVEQSKYSSKAGFLAEAILDLIDTELLRIQVLPDGWQSQLPSLREYFADLIAELPGLDATLTRRSTWYSDDLRELRRVGP
jgi:hypothetical protein